MGINEIQKSHGEQFMVKQLMKTRKGIEAKLKKLNDTKRKDTVIDFEQLGVDRLFIDEKHFYKNLYLYTKMRHRPDRSPEVKRLIYEMPISGRNHGKPWHGDAYLELNGRDVLHPEVLAV